MYRKRLFYLSLLCAATLFAADEAVEPLKELPRGALLFSGQVPDVSLEKMALSPDGSRIAATGTGGKVILFDTATAKVIKTIDVSGDCAAIDFNTDGKSVFVAGPGQDVHEYDVDEGKLKRTFSEHKYDLRNLALSPDGSRLASTDAHGTLILWDTASAKPLFTLTPKVYPDDAIQLESPAEGLVFTPDGRYVVTEAMDVKARVWDVALGKEIRMVANHDGTTAALSASPRGDLIASTRNDGILRLWRPSTGAIQKVLKGHTGNLTCDTFAPDGATVFSGALDATIRQWDTETGTEIRRFKLSAAPTSIVTSSNGRMLYSLSPDAGLVVWDISGPPVSDDTAEMKLTSLSVAWLALSSREFRSRAEAVNYFLRYKDGAEAANFLVSHLQQPEQAPEVQHRQRELILQLDAPDFADRERAFDELRELGEKARAAVQAALQNPSSEVRTRAGALMKLLGPAQDARAVLAVDILIWMHSAAAKEALSAVATREGTLEAARAQEALRGWNAKH